MKIDMIANTSVLYCLYILQTRLKDEKKLVVYTCQTS